MSGVACISDPKAFFGPTFRSRTATIRRERDDVSGGQNGAYISKGSMVTDVE